jgi:hypothetical protein
VGTWQLIAYFFVALGMSVLSGIAGSGGGFITTPVAILLGLSPAQAISSGKFNGLANAIGSLTGFRKYPSSVTRRSIIAIMLLALVIGLTSPLVIKSFESKWYQITLGVILLLLIPVMIYSKAGITATKPSRRRRTLGFGLLSISLFLQGAFSGGLGTLVNVVLMGMLGMTTNEAHITKRWAQLVLNITIIVGVFGSGFILWPVAIAGLVACLIGSSVGSRIAVRQGDAFANHILLVLMGAAAIMLIASAL